MWHKHRAEAAPGTSSWHPARYLETSLPPYCQIIITRHGIMAIRLMQKKLLQTVTACEKSGRIYREASIDWLLVLLLLLLRTWCTWSSWTDWGCERHPLFRLGSFRNSSAPNDYIWIPMITILSYTGCGYSYLMWSGSYQTKKQSPRLGPKGPEEKKLFQFTSLRRPGLSAGSGLLRLVLQWHINDRRPWTACR